MMVGGLANAIEAANSGDWDRQKGALPVLAAATGRPDVDEVLLSVLVDAEDLAPICDAAALVLSEGTPSALKVLAAAWHRAELAEQWGVGDCHADALRSAHGVGAVEMESWLSMIHNADPEVAAGAESICEWLRA